MSKLVNLRALALFCLWFCCLVPSLWAQERRKDQFLSEPSYLIFPLVYSIPGIGSGTMVTALAGNAGGTYVDVYALALAGDVEGTILGVQDLHVIPKTLILGGFYQGLSKAHIQYYQARGMNTTKNDYQFMELNKVDFWEPSFTLTFWERRIELFGAKFTQGVGVTRILDPDGNLIAEYNPAYQLEFKSSMAGLRLDFTDDLQDPYKGVRFQASESRSPRIDARFADYKVQNLGVSAYLPLGSLGTWGFHQQTSDAVVASKGQTDPTAIAQEFGITCPDTDPVCQATLASLVNIAVAERTYGTAQSLGGQYLMRAYPQGRFQGAHTLYRSTELRLFLSHEVTPFDFWIWKDVSTGIQLALFWEQGATADLKSDVTKGMRTSKGAGLRMVSASGFVYRFDVASGDEGTASTVIFNYPW